MSIIGMAVWALCVLPGLAAAHVIHYRGTAVAVPDGWPVVNLAAQPRLCVRFDRPAVYLGRPGAQQRCPAIAIGRPRAILIEPRGAAGAQVVHRAAQTIAAGRLPRASRPRVAGASFSGLGFDACSAPSAPAMKRWRASPYRAVGVYIGGTNMACAQPNLTASWVRAQTAAGWHFILTYVGLQAPGNSCGCASIDPSQAAAQGRAAATDAVSRASSLGLGPGSPIYFDMEAYTQSQTNTSAALSFLAAWTRRLHTDGYKSGVYSSSASGISDLVARYGTSYQEPDDIWFAEWNGNRTTTSSYIPAADWSAHQRLHQYVGDHNETYGGVTLQIDGDAVDGATATAGSSSLIPEGTFIQVASTGQIFRIAGGAPLYVSDWNAVGGPQPYTQISGQELSALNPVPLDGTFLTTAAGALYRVAGGTPFQITEPSIFPGARPIQIDGWDISNIDNSLAHLNAVPADGAVVQGLPSRGYWIFTQGQRRRTAASPATAVDDAGLAQFPMQPCVVPKLSHLTLADARAALAQTDCRLGRVTRRRKPRPGHPLHVVRQSPASGANRPALSAVAVTLS